MSDTNASVRSVENPVLPKDEKSLTTVDYDEMEKKYLTFLQNRLEQARNNRDRTHDEFDGMTYLQQYESNNKLMNSFIEPKKNKEDTNFVTGTTRQALLALTARVNGYNLLPEVRAYDRNDTEAVGVGRGVEGIVLKAGELDHDEEKRPLRQHELYGQGTVFVEENWTEEFAIEKNLKDKWKLGQVKGVEWETKLTKVFEGCRRNVIPGPNVYLGSMREFMMNSQPFVFTVDVIPYEQAREIYGTWERWRFVTKQLTQIVPTEQRMMYLNNWRLTETPDGFVEVIKYQDKWANEYAVVLNGVLMTPAGFPLPWKHREYNIDKQIFEIITPFFPYGGSLPKRLKTSQALENEFWRLAILETQKKFQPPRGNLTKKVLSSRVFMPGKLTAGIRPEQLPPLTDAQGVGPNEVKFLQMLRDNMNQNSLPDVSKAQAPAGDPTATEIIAIQREARVLFNMAIFTAAMLEKKLSTLRLYDVIENWMEPTGTVLDDAKKMIVNKYRSASVTAPISGVGRGRRIVELSDVAPNPKDLYQAEESLSRSEGRPVRKIVLNPGEVRDAGYVWRVDVFPKEKESTDLDKVLFDQMLRSAMAFGPDINLQFFEERFAEVWNIPADKAFHRGVQQMAGNVASLMGAGGASQAGAGNPTISMNPAEQRSMAGGPQQRPSINTLQNMS